MEINYDVIVEELKKKHLSKKYKDNSELLDGYATDLLTLVCDIIKNYISKQEDIEKCNGDNINDSLLYKEQKNEYKRFFKKLNISSSINKDCYIFLCDEELTFIEGCSDGCVTYDEICNYEGRIYPPNTALSTKDIMSSIDNEFDLTIVNKKGEHKTYGKLSKENLYKTCFDLVSNGEDVQSIAIFNLKDSMPLDKYADILNL